MFQDHQRDDVAVWREILFDSQAIGQLSDILALGIVDGLTHVSSANDQIAQVRL